MTLKLRLRVLRAMKVSSFLLMKALTVAVIVGSVLVLINQHEAIFGDHSFRWLPGVLTYCVPFCVFLAGQISACGSSDLKPDI